MRSRYRKILIAAGAALASMAVVAPVTQAAPPAAPYQDFAGCPSPAENELIAQCFKYTFDGGHLQLGQIEVPITNPIVFRGGAESVTGKFAGNSEAGIVPVQQPVPGGLGKLLGVPWLMESYSPSLLKVTATVELAGTPGSLSPISLPIKVHLENPILGSKCYVGSNASPITLNISTKTTNPPPPNEPISGQAPEPLQPEAERPEVSAAANGILVDNAFAVPSASGCTLNSVLNSTNQLPSAAGNNEAVFNFDFARVFQSVVYP